MRWPWRPHSEDERTEQVAEAMIVNLRRSAERLQKRAESAVDTARGYLKDA